MLVAASGCGGASANARPAEPLVIPPMPSNAAPVVAPLPITPPSPHTPSHEECETIMRRLIDLTLDQSTFSPPQRDELVKIFMSNPDTSKQVCGTLEIDDESMRCIADASKLDDLQKCMAAMRGRKDDGDGDR